MPYVIVSGNLTPSRTTSVGVPGWKVAISGLKAFELEDLKRFALDQADAHTVVFRHHPVVLLNALEVLGYRVISSFNSGSENCVWTMRKDFPVKCPTDDSSDEEDSAEDSE